MVVVVPLLENRRLNELDSMAPWLSGGTVVVVVPLLRGGMGVSRTLRSMD